MATIHFADEYEFTHVVVDKDVVWAGTDSGLLWGGLLGRAQGKPWPIFQNYMGWSGTLFGTRDTRDFEYRWKFVSYNTATIIGLEKRGSDLWVSYRSQDGFEKKFNQARGESPKDVQMEPIIDTRVYLNIDEYIVRKQKPQYESYGLNADIKGEPRALHVTSDSSRVLIGTTKGLWELEQ